MNLAFNLLVCCLVNNTAQDSKPVELDELLAPVILPLGYEKSVRDIKDGEKNYGKMIIVSKPDQIAKVTVQIERTDRSTAPARRTATKAYVNGLATGLAGAGYKLVDKRIPEINEEKFVKPLSIDLVFANGEKKLFVHQEIFFTDKGFLVQAIAEDAETLAELVKWSKTIKLKP